VPLEGRVKRRVCFGYGLLDLDQLRILPPPGFRLGLSQTLGSNGTSSVTQTLDGLGRLANTQSGYGGTVVSEVDTTYGPCACSPLGKMTQQSEPYAPATDTPVYTVYTYDALGRTLTVTLPDGSATNYVYQGNVTTVTDPAGKWKQYYRDAFGNLVTVVEPDPASNPAPPVPSTNSYPLSSAPANTLLSSYLYDPLNHLTKVTMPRMVGGVLQTQTRTFVYDATTERLASASNPENGTVSYSYNGDGSLASKTDAKGNTETYTYDSYGRLTGIPDRQQTFTYDTNAPGMLVQASFASGVGPNQLSFQYQYSYTPAGKVADKTLYLQSANHAPASASLTTSYAYDNEGALMSTSYPGGPYPVLTYTRDALERPTALGGIVPGVSGVTYNAANQITGGMFPTGMGDSMKETRTYNNLQQLTRIQQEHWVSYCTPNCTWLDMTYNYTGGHNNGQIVSSVDAVSGETITYQYDALQRLSSASSTQAWSETYGYDGFGNLTGMTPTGSAPPLSLTVNPASNQVTGPGAIRYDANGNLVATPLWILTYDAANRVAAANGDTYAYDADNRRVYQRTAAGTETIWVYGAEGEKLETYTVTGIANNAIQLSVQSQNMYFAGRLIVAENYGVGVDRVGSVRWNAANGPTFRTYYPYGVEYSGTANDTEKYATYTRDSVTGLDYAVNRYYASIWGRFTSPDPKRRSMRLADPGSLNRYAYALDDPVNKNDRTGLCADMIAGMTMGSNASSPFNQMANLLQANMAFPYSGEGILTSLTSVLGQAGGSNSSTQVALQSIQSALANNAGSIDIVAYSGGAAAFTAAYAQLSAAQQARIGSVLYISPGAAGSVTTVAGATSVVLGQGGLDVVATFGTSVPPGTPITSTACSHTDLACLFNNALSQLATIESHGPCRSPGSFSLSSGVLSPAALPVLHTPGYWTPPLVGGEIYKSDGSSESSSNADDGLDPSVSSTITWGDVVPDP
jgi:RHS repeat-associated protein